MSFVQFSKVSLAFGDRDILKDVSVHLASGTKAALAGVNGCGKSTLMKVLAGILPCDSGDRAVQKDTRISYLPQSGIVYTGNTVRQEADKAFQFGYDWEKELEQIGEQLQSAGSDEKAAPLLGKYHELQQKLELSGWYHRESALQQVLTGLGFEEKDFDRSVTEFSGGWQMRIALAKVLLENPDILLLDEPTNYLDLEARSWLENWLLNYKGGFLLVSHDRYFLDTTVNEVYELFNAQLVHYTGNYSDYEKTRRMELDSLVAKYAQQQAEIKKLEDFIRRFGAKATKAAQAQERMKMLEKIERIEIPENLKKIHFTFPPAPHSGKIVLSLEEIGKTYPSSVPGVADNVVIKDMNLIVENGERLVVAGKNGAGKTTLLRILAGEDTSFDGNVKLGAGAKIGYFSQDSAEQMKTDKTVLETLESEAPFEMIPKLRDMLGAFLFRGDDVYKSVSVLSGGEKSRLALLQLLLRPVNLLILDEPTNHLDLSSKDVLLDALKDFGGTVVFVSHDRGFIESLATRVLELRHGEYRVFPGDYRYYAEQIQKEQNAVSGSNSPTAQKQPEPASDKQLDYEERKKKRNERRKLEREEEELLTKISQAEEHKEELSAKMEKSEVYSDAEKSRKVQAEIEKTEKELQELTKAWEAVAEKLAQED